MICKHSVLVIAADIRYSLSIKIANLPRRDAAPPVAAD